MGLIQEFQQADAQRRKEVATMLGDFREGDAQRRREVATMRADADAFVDALHRVSAERRTLVWGGAAPVGRAAPPPGPTVARPRAAAPPPPPPAPPRIKEAVPPPVAEEEAIPAEAETAETMALRDLVFEYLADHPDGARLADMEREFGVARIQIARALRGLMDDNKVEKRELLYFAI